MTESTTVNDPRLWSDQPASEWLAAYPVGNGQIGGMVFGGIGHERIGLNHERLWRGVTRDRNAPDVAARLPDIRDAFFAGNMARGAELAEDILGGHGRRIMPYQPIGDVLIDVVGDAPDVTSYEREIDLTSGVAATTWTHDNHTTRRLVFASADYNALVIQMETTDPAGMDLAFRFERREVDPGKAPNAEGWVGPQQVRLTPWSRRNRAGLVGIFDEGISFATEIRITVDGDAAEVSAPDQDAARLVVHGATSITAIIGIGAKTDATLMNRRDAIASHLDAVPTSFERLLTSHLAEHVPAMNRVRFDLPVDPEIAALPLPARLERLRAGNDDPGLACLWFAYGRYLLFSSSRRCDEPANLQGVWCEDLDPPWQSDFHLNINIQMNYWPAESTNLPECLAPLVSFVERFLPSAREVAQRLYGADGIVMPHATDCWGRATPEAPVCDVWQGAASWLAQHLWWHWEFTGDDEFLRDHAYPYLKACAAFWMDFLVPEARQHHPLTGKLVSVPSNSPENSYWWEGNRLRYGIGATMDGLLAREVLRSCLTASEHLEVDSDERSAWQTTLDALAPFQIGQHGQLQEWVDDWDEPEPGHRHLSHLYGIYPGHDPAFEEGSALRAAARASLERRLSHGGGHTGWSRSWVSALWAHFGEGDLAKEHLDQLIAQFATDALLDLHPPRIFQIDGNLGGTAAIAEMLLQSDGGIVRLLPALPTAWPHGSIIGIRARGGHIVDIRWSAALLHDAVIRTRSARLVRVRVPDDRLYRVEEFANPGSTIAIERTGNLIEWVSCADCAYRLLPA